MKIHCQTLAGFALAALFSISFNPSISHAGPFDVLKDAVSNATGGKVHATDPKATEAARRTREQLLEGQRRQKEIDALNKDKKKVQEQRQQAQQKADRLPLTDPKLKATALVKPPPILRSGKAKATAPVKPPPILRSGKTSASVSAR